MIKFINDNINSRLLYDIIIIYYHNMRFNHFFFNNIIKHIHDNIKNKKFIDSNNDTVKSIINVS